MSAEVTPGSAWRAYFEGSSMLSTMLEAQLKEQCDLDLGDFNILLVLHEQGGRMRLGQLAKHISFAPGRLTYRVSNLEKRGWVRRERIECDRRGFEAVLTDEGSKALRRSRPIHARHVQSAFLDRLSQEQVAALDEIFAPLLTELREQQA